MTLDGTRATIAGGLYLASIVLANMLIEWFGVVDVVPGPWTLMAPAAVYAAGFALVARDILHETLDRTITRRGLYVVLAALIVAGACLSVVFGGDGRIAVASGVAFLLSETIDLIAYRDLRDNGWTTAAVGSSIIGGFADSLVFLGIAFGSYEFLWGQWAGKTIAVVAVVAVAAPLRRYWAPDRPRATAAA
jgi:uncharacterized PurR-regulated membrane protein YhhQ (DUF165 family)